MQVELAYYWRSENPARFDIGPVLDRDDVVTGKVLALWGAASVHCQSSRSVAV